MTLFNIERCLEIHEQQLDSHTSIPSSYSHPPAPAPANLCPQCHAMRQVAENLLTELIDINSTADALGEVHFTESDIAMRRAAGLHALHEKVTLKELHAPSTAPALPSLPLATSSRLTRTQTRAEQIRLRAEQELNLLRSQSQPALKWTWGPDLTKQEILTTKGKQKAHSGYQRPLSAGRQQGEWSVTASLPAGTVLYSEVGSSANLPPHRPPQSLQSAMETMSIVNDPEHPAAPTADMALLAAEAWLNESSPPRSPSPVSDARHDTASASSILSRNIVDLAADAYLEDSAESSGRSSAGSYLDDPAARAAEAWCDSDSDDEGRTVEDSGVVRETSSPGPPAPGVNEGPPMQNMLGLESAGTFHLVTRCGSDSYCPTASTRPGHPPCRSLGWARYDTYHSSQTEFFPTRRSADDSTHGAWSHAGARHCDAPIPSRVCRRHIC